MTGSVIAETTETSASSVPQFALPAIAPGKAAIIPLIDPPQAVVVRAAEGERDTVVTKMDLTTALVGGNPIVPTWTDPSLVIAAYGLSGVRQATERLLREVFGSDAAVRDEIEVDPESRKANLVFTLVISVAQRGLRGSFLDRYARETTLPDGAPVPGLLWDYRDAVPS
ncbi:MAG TPA: hypothetical protein VJL28_00510 [Gemmatimonadaceae bacterium]|nr:hypothetical protein [Gemmatimonadaceae bacterium]